MKGQLKIFFMAFTMYFSHPIFTRLFNRWYTDEPNFEGQLDTAKMLFKRFWLRFLLILTVIGTTVLVLVSMNVIEDISSSYALRIAAATMASTAALSRGGWDIQTWTGKTICERVDRIMFDVSQLGAVVLLVLAFSL